MSYLLAVPAIVLVVVAIYLLTRRPDWLLYCYLVAVPVLPPLPVGSIEISALDFLAIPALINVIYNMAQNGARIKGPFTIGLFLYTLAALISFISFTLQHTMFSVPIFLRLIRLMEMFLPVLLASQILHRLRKESAIGLFLIGGGLTALIGLIMYLSGFTLHDLQSFTFEGEFIFRAGGTHGDSGSFGNLMAITTLVALWVLIYSKTFSNKRERNRLVILASISGAFSLFALMTSLSRAGALLLLLGFCVLLAPSLKRPGRLVKILIVTTVVLLVIAGLFYTQVENYLVIAAVEAFQQRILGMSELASDFATISSHRNVMWQKSWNIFKNSPLAWSLGLGYKSLKLHFGIPPDNNFFQSLFEMGILGAASLLALVILGFSAAMKQIHRNLGIGFLMLALWLGYVSSMTTGDYLTCWHNVPVLFILLTVCAKRSEQ